MHEVCTVGTVHTRGILGLRLGGRQGLFNNIGTKPKHLTSLLYFAGKLRDLIQVNTQIRKESVTFRMYSTLQIAYKEKCLR